MKKFLILLTCVLMLVGCGKKKEEVKENKVDPKVELTDVTVSINEEVTNKKGIVKIEDGELLTEESPVDTSKLGEQEIVIKVKDKDGNEKEYTYKIIVEDKEAPVIEAKDSITTEAGTKVDLLKGVKVTDNSSEELKATVDGSYDFNKVGTYKLAYVAKDSSGNEARKDFSLIVKEKQVVEPKPQPQPTPGNGGSNNNKLVFRTEGTDSSWNGKTTSKGYTITVSNGIAYIDGILIANKTFSLPSTYAPGMNGNVTAHANEMFSAAKAAGYTMWNQSGFRSYETQKKLYTNYVNRSGKQQADTFSARPGNSEHQSGLAFDVCATNRPCINSNFDNTAEAKWLSENAYKYGFILRYPKGKSGETGYKYESWHFRYVGVDLATKLYNGGDWITLESYFGITSEYDY